MAMWNPWRGCKKCSDGCLHCYIHKGDLKRNINTNEIVKTKDFERTIEKLKSGNFDGEYFKFNFLLRIFLKKENLKKKILSEFPTKVQEEENQKYII